MNTPNWSQKEYVSAAAFNAGAGAVSGDFALALSSGLLPGLVRPDVATYSSTGLTATVGLPSPFALLNASGVLAGAHGTQTGMDSQSYSVSFSGVVPGGGSVTAYLAASAVVIGQQPYVVTGPPPGHPDYDPTFVAYTAYAVNVNSVALFATTTAPDLTDTFELARCTLSAGASALPSFDTSHQRLMAPLGALHRSSATSGITLTQANAGIMQRGTTTLAYTLPPASGCSDLIFPFMCRAASGMSVQTVGSDEIYGLWNAPNTGAASTTMVYGQAMSLYSDGSSWQAMGLSGGFNAAGQVAFFTALPTGSSWIMASGQSLLTSTYPLLAAALGASGTSFTVPDLRGQFLRAWDDGAGVDPGRALLSNQAYAVQSHLHSVGLTGSSSGSGTYSGTTATESATHAHTTSSGSVSVASITSGPSALTGGSAVAGIDLESLITGTENATHTHAYSGTVTVTGGATISGNTGSTGSSETRPTNFSLIACISTGV